ncbi:MAG: MFS transporter [Microscillaceae bacterium]|nr:MFS transporter [Microscillaceae bacterium]MDW8459619.1 MFS transporter [Cytophagales bacterium]
MSENRLSPYLALQNAEFRFFLAMRLCVTLAVQMQAVIVGWQIYELTQKDTLYLGLIGLTEAVPSILIALYAGHLVDMYSRKKILQKVFYVLVFASACLWLLSWQIVQVWIGKPIFPIFGVIFLIGLARGFVSPAYFAFLTQVVSQKELQNAIAWNSTNWQIGMVIGPALGGLVYAFLGVQMAYLLQTLLFVFALIFLGMIAHKPAPPKPEVIDLRERMWSGVQFVFSQPIILGAISLDLFAVLFGGAVAILPAFASDVLSVGAEGLGFLRSAPAVGSVVMAIALAYYPVRKHAGKRLLLAVAGFGISIIAFALSTNFWLSLLCLFLSGAFDSVSVIIRSNLLQTHTPEAMKGRVSAVNSIFISSSNEIGAFESGVAAKLLGLVPSVIFGGVMTLVVVIIIAWKVPQLRNLDL